MGGESGAYKIKQNLFLLMLAATKTLFKRNKKGDFITTCQLFKSCKIFLTKLRMCVRRGRKGGVSKIEKGERNV